MDNSTEYMKVRTKGNSSPQGKPRVYFTCHPADFDKYFESVCADIFKTHDCAIYYTADMSAPLPETYRETDLGNMNLFVMPITWRLLSEPNRAMDSDFAFADEKHYPVLPLMMEPGIDSFYQEKFGKRQYLSPVIHDATAISYEEKLKKYLTAILVDDETAERVRAAFDAYIFLSYRKKDRHHANELMRLIHENPKYRDIAIWYDEYLTPGENFDDVIRKAMGKSELFTMLVTPNLINEENYVQSEEYPAAQRAAMQILPAEMVETDREELGRQYEKIPPCVDAHKREELDGGLLNALKEIAIRENDGDPEHNYLIGLAYLEGIDVEVNVERGIELITSAAEAELPEAMEKLYNLYHDGGKVRLNYSQALYWAQRLTDYYTHKRGKKDRAVLTWMLAQSSLCNKLGDESAINKALKLNRKCYALSCKTLGKTRIGSLAALNALAMSYGKLGKHQKQLALNIECYTSRRGLLGEKHLDTLESMNNLASSYGKSENYEKARELNERCYTLRREIQGETHLDTLTSLSNLASIYSALRNYEKALELNEKCYTLRRKIRGEMHPDTLTSLNNLASSYSGLGNHQEALELQEKCYASLCEVLGEKHPHTLTSLSNLAFTCGELGNHKKKLELLENCYVLRREVMSQKHPDTLTSLSNLAFCYYELGIHEKALMLSQQCYTLRCKMLGKTHPSALESLNNLALAYIKLENHKKASELLEKCYALCRSILGETHPTTLASFGNLAYAYGKLGNHEKSLALNKKCYTLYCKTQGKTLPAALTSLNNLALSYGELGNYKKALQLHEECYALRCEILGEKHPDTLGSLQNLVYTHSKLGNRDKVWELYKKLLREKDNK